MHGEKTKLDIKKHDGEDVSNSVSEKQKLWKEWKQENTSKEKHLEAKKKVRRTVYQTKCKAENKRFGNVIQRHDQNCDVRLRRK